MSTWQVGFLESCAESDGVALSEGAFAPGPALWVAKREIAHFDDVRTVDVRLTRAVIGTRREELSDDDRVSLRSSASDWLELHIRSDTDEDWARTVIRDAIEANLLTAPPGLPPTGTDLVRRRGFH